MTDHDDLNEYRIAHERVHAALAISIHEHQLLPAHTSLEPRVRALEDYALQTKTFALMLKVVFGTSILAAITGVLTLITLIEHLAT